MNSLGYYISCVFEFVRCFILRMLYFDLCMLGTFLITCSKCEAKIEKISYPRELRVDK
jgi:hypothetical protein